MSYKPKLLSGKVPVKDSANVASDRYQFLELSSAEPNLGPSSNGNILTYNTATPGQRLWISQQQTEGYLLAQDAYNQANSAYEEANVAYILAQGAFDKANTGVPGSGGGLPRVDFGFVYETVYSYDMLDLGQLV